MSGSLIYKLPDGRWRAVLWERGEMYVHTTSTWELARLRVGAGPYGFRRLDEHSMHRVH